MAQRSFEVSPFLTSLFMAALWQCRLRLCAKMDFHSGSVILCSYVAIKYFQLKYEGAYILDINNTIVV
jgi:hypothetical protein